MHPLDSVWLKVERAKEHLDFLYTEIDGFWKLDSCSLIGPEEDPEQPGHVFRFEVRQEPPLRWSVLVGDFAFNLRSALDHLAWQLAILKVGPSREPNRRTEFPIFNSPVAYKDPGRGATPKLKDIIAAAHPVIEQLQPYHRGNWPEVDHLWWLHELNRIDKHQAIVPCFVHPTIQFGDATGIFRGRRLHDGDYIVVVPQSHADLNLKIGVDVGFEFPGIPFGINFRRLDGIHKFIRQEVIPRFTGFFQQSEVV